jgi:hypothetical protein
VGEWILKKNELSILFAFVTSNLEIRQCWDPSSGCYSEQKRSGPYMQEANLFAPFPKNAKLGLGAPREAAYKIALT